MPEEQRFLPLLSAEQRGQTSGSVHIITPKHFIGALAIEHDLDPGRLSRLKDPLLTVDARARKWLSLKIHQVLQVGSQLFGLAQLVVSPGPLPVHVQVVTSFVLFISLKDEF